VGAGLFDKNASVQTFISNYGYWALFFLAVLESACIPIPSEVTFGFAGALCASQFAASAGLDHPLDALWVIVVGVAGSIVGSIIAYEFGRSAGRAIVDRWGKWILLSHADLDRAEAWFHQWGGPSVLIGRVVPVVRTVISVPAGVARMPRGAFLAFTAIGCTVWVTFLTLIGKAAGSNWSHVAGIVRIFEWPIIVLVAVGLIWGFVHRWRQVRGHHAG
jgi:membrane protein DedA with SNARE-associated domain